MNYPAHDRFPFHRNGNAYRRDADAKPRVLLLGSVADPAGDFAGVIVHIAGDEFTREISRHSINAELINDLEPAQAFALGCFVEGGELDLDQSQTSRYVEPVVAKSTIWFGDQQSQRRTSATTGAFFLPVFNGGSARAAFELAGFLCDRFANLRTAASIFLARDAGGSKSQRSHTVKTILSLPRRRTRAKAHRKMAMAALRADSSRSVRQARFDHHMTIARNIERGLP